MDIVERLRSVGGTEGTTRWYINPDGPEAADEIERLREALKDIEKLGTEDNRLLSELKGVEDNA
jgi:hypothetical protein